MNAELKSQILQHGEGIQVMEPKELKEEIFSTICKMKEN